jgi:hypothetical protein
MVAKNYPDEILRPHDLENEVAELSLLLPAWQIDALERAAQTEGITVAHLLRRVINRALTQTIAHEPGYYYG